MHRCIGQPASLRDGCTTVRRRDRWARGGCGCVEDATTATDGVLAEAEALCDGAEPDGLDLLVGSSTRWPCRDGRVRKSIGKHLISRRGHTASVTNRVIAFRSPFRRKPA
jgi:hypothetical protein